MHKRLFARSLIEVASLFCDEGTMRGSAKLCLADAGALFNKGEYTDAFERALTSLKYSVGVFSPIYEWAIYLNIRF